jgi:ubiquitin carboxyl-terminal hydrolase 7
LLDQGTAVEGTIQRLFEGHRVSRIKCTKINYTSSKNEPFYGMQFNMDYALMCFN